MGGFDGAYRCFKDALVTKVQRLRADRMTAAVAAASAARGRPPCPRSFRQKSPTPSRRRFMPVKGHRDWVCSDLTMMSIGRQVMHLPPWPLIRRPISAEKAGAPPCRLSVARCRCQQYSMLRSNRCPGSTGGAVLSKACMILRLGSLLIRSAQLRLCSGCWSMPVDTRPRRRQFASARGSSRQTTRTIWS